MIRRHHHLNFISKERNHFHIADVQRQGDDAEFDGALLNFLNDLMAEIAVNADLDQGIELFETGEGFRKHIKASCFVGADLKLAARCLVKLSDGLQGFLMQLDDFLGVAL